MKLKFDESLLKKHVDNIVRYTLDMDMLWDWPCGVAYYGVASIAKATDNDEYKDMLKAWVDEYIELDVPPSTVNRCAMGHCLLDLYEYTNEQKYFDIIMRKIDYLRNKAPRFGDNTLQHTVSVRDDFPEQCWADTLFMAAFFMLRVGVLTEDKELIDDALHQYCEHIKYLQDPKTNLWYHGYNNIEKNHMSAIYWARANAWAAYTMSQIVTVLPEPYLYTSYLEIKDALEEQFLALKKKQQDSGYWNTVLDNEQAYGEMSATCGIAAAMASYNNPLHTKYVQKSLDLLMQNIDDMGRVQNVSAGTAIMNTVEDYCKIPTKRAQGWGQGLALAFIAHVLTDINPTS